MNETQIILIAAFLCFAAVGAYLARYMPLVGCGVFLFGMYGARQFIRGRTR